MYISVQFQARQTVTGQTGGNGVGQVVATLIHSSIPPSWIDDLKSVIGGRVPGQKAHIRALVCALVRAPKLICAPKLV